MSQHDHSIRGLVSALKWFRSVLEAAVGGAPDDASQGCLLGLSLPCLLASLCDHCADVSDLLPLSLNRVHLYRLCSSSEQGTNRYKCVRCAQNTYKLFHLSRAGECHPSCMEATGGSVKMFMCAKEVTQPEHTNTQREPKKHRPRQTDRQTDRNTHTHTHTHTPGRQGCDMLGTCWLFS